MTPTRHPLPQGATLLRWPGQGEHGTLLFAHGGGFLKGDPADPPAPVLAERMQPLGWRFASVGYRLRTPLRAFAPEDADRIREQVARGDRAGLRCARRLRGAAQMAAALDIGAAIAALRADHTGPVVLLGISAGAIAGGTLVYPPAGWEDRLTPPDALIGITGAIAHPWRIAPRRPPVLFFHGTRDRIVPPADPALAARRARQQGASFDLIDTGIPGHNPQVEAVLAARSPHWQGILRFLGRLGEAPEP